MTRTVYLVMSETIPFGQAEIMTRVLALLSDPDDADRFRDQYQRQCGRRETVWIEERELDDPDDYLEIL